MTRAQIEFRQRQIEHLWHFPCSVAAALQLPFDMGLADLEDFFENNDKQFDLYPRLCEKMGIDPYPELLIETQPGTPTPQSDLGLNVLSDDQLLNLCEQARLEIWSRGFVLFQNIWQNTAKQQDAEFKARTEAWIQGVKQAEDERAAKIFDDARARVHKLASKGVLKLLEPEQEKLIVEAATLETKLALLEAFRLKMVEDLRNSQARQQSQGQPINAQGQRQSNYGREAYPKAYGMGDRMPGSFAVPQNPISSVCVTSSVSFGFQGSVTFKKP